jgi:hypothetical protein
MAVVFLQKYACWAKWSIPFYWCSKRGDENERLEAERKKVEELRN